MSYQVTDIHGVTRLRPDHAEMVRIVGELYAAAPDAFEEATLTHRSGAGLSLYANGTVVWDEPDRTQYLVIEGLSRTEQLTLWVQLAAGNLQAIRNLDWSEQGTPSDR